MRKAGVVVMSDDVETGLALWQFRMVKIENVATIFVDQILTAQKPFLDEGRIGGW